MWKRLQFPVLVIGCFLGSCFSEVIKCNVTQSPDGTLYSVSGYTGFHCEYSWDRNGTVIANRFEKHEQVVTCSNRTLKTSQCYEEIIFTCDCLSGPVLNANCTTNCSDNGGRQNGGTPADHIIVPLAVIIPLLLIGVCCYVAYRRGVCRAKRANQPNHQAGGDDI